jgi:orotidine-5'-phosphate decarboxylase
MTTAFSDRLADAVRAKSSCLVVGLDPVVERLPTELIEAAKSRYDDPRKQAAEAIVLFHRAVIDQVADKACAVKPQLAYFEQWGAPGLAAYEQSVLMAREAGLLVIADAKRGDIGSTSAAYVRAHLDPPQSNLRADAVTVNPYLGSDCLAPYLDAVDDLGSGLFVLVRTSNPSAGELQDLPSGPGTVHERVADLVAAWGADRVGQCGYSSVGAVVGATAPEQLAALRKRMPTTWFLLPGVGAQGATAADVACAFDEEGLGAVVNSSRGILYAYGEPDNPDWCQAIGNAASTLRDELRVAAGGAHPG